MKTTYPHRQGLMTYGKMTFFDPDDESGGAALLDDVPMEAPSADEGVVDDVVEKPEASGFDPAAFATQFGETFAKTFQAQQPAAREEKKLSPEEAAKLLNVWEPNDEWYAKYDNLDTRKAAIKEQRDALVRQSDTIAQIRMQQMREDLMKEFSPIRESLQRQEAAAQQTRFASSYPELGKAEMQPLVSAVTKSLLEEGKRFGNEKEAFTAVAGRVEQVMRASNPNFKLSAPSARSKSDGGIPVTTPGAGGGGGTGGKPAATKGASRALQILGPVGGE